MSLPEPRHSMARTVKPLEWEHQVERPLHRTRMSLQKGPHDRKLQKHDPPNSWAPNIGTALGPSKHLRSRFAGKPSWLNLMSIAVAIHNIHLYSTIPATALDPLHSPVCAVVLFHPRWMIWAEYPGQRRSVFEFRFLVKVTRNQKRHDAPGGKERYETCFLGSKNDSK